MRLLQAEAARLEAPEQSLDLPPPAVIGERVGGDARRGDYDVLAARESQPRQVQLHPPALPQSGQRQPDARPLRAEEPPRLHHLPAPVGDQCVTLDADAEVDALPAQVAEQSAVSELAVGRQKRDTARAEEADEAPHGLQLLLSRG